MFYFESNFFMLLSSWEQNCKYKLSVELIYVRRRLEFEEIWILEQFCV